jgi:hypothetical protein
VKIPSDALIVREKLTHYLLVHRVKDDKSRYLASGGFDQSNPEALEAAIRRADGSDGGSRQSARNLL